MREAMTMTTPAPSAQRDAAGQVAISVIIPVYNEELNVDEMHERLSAVLDDSAEMIFVDDGSTDTTYAKLQAIADRDPRVRLVRFRTNFGQTAALSAGIDHARGRII